MDVLITGANGVIGSRLVAQYLAQTDHELLLLVRGRDTAHAAQRMDEALRFWDLPLAESHARIQVLRGDVTQPRLGLAEETARSLRSRVGGVIHGASNIRLDLSAAQARRDIVGGLRQVLDLVREGPALQRFGFLSTLEVAGRMQGVVQEAFLPSRPPFLNSYELGKYECEELLRDEAAAGLPLTVFRPGMVVGEATTGKTIAFQSFYLMLEKLLIAPDAPLLPRGPAPDTVPVDVLALGIQRLMEDPSARDQFYHFSQGLDDHLPFDGFIERLRPLLEQRLNRPLPRTYFTSPRLFQALLKPLGRLPGRIGRGARKQLIFLEYSTTTWRAENAKARAALHRFGAAWPRFDDYIPALLDYYLPRRGESRMPL